MPTDLPDLYVVLGLPRTATGSEIRARYRKLIKEEHPDRFAGERARAVSEGDPERVRRIDERMALAQQRSRLLNQAHDILGDPRKRQQYDRSQWMRGSSGPQYRPSDPMRQTPRPQPRPPNPAQHPPKREGPARLIFNRTVIDFGTTPRDQQVARVIQVDNPGRIPPDFSVDWLERVPWASFEVHGNPRETFPIAVRVRIDTRGIPYGRHLLELIFTADGRTTHIPVIVHVQDPAWRPVPPNRPPAYSAPQKTDSDRIANLRAASVPFIIIAVLVLRMLMSSASAARLQQPLVVYPTFAAISDRLVTPTRAPRSPTRPPSTPRAWPTPRIAPVITATAKPVQIGMPVGWQAVSAETIASGANWRPTPKTPFDIGGDARLAHQGDIFEWVLPAWVTHEWWLTLNPPGDSDDQMISARIQVFSDQPMRYGLITSYEDETRYTAFFIDPGAKAFTISRMFGEVNRQESVGLLLEGVDPANVWLTILMADGHSTFMIDGVVVYESDLLPTDGRVGFYAKVAPYNKVTLSIDNVTIATP